VVFTALLAVSTCLLFGLAPAWRASDPALAATLKANARGTRSGARLNLSKALVVAQVALSLLLVGASGLFLQSIRKLASVPLGYDAAHVVSASINPRIGGYGPDDLAPLYRRVLDRVETLPGVQAAAIGTCGLMTGCRSNAHGLVIAGYQPQPGEEIVVQENQVSAGYLRTAGMTLVSGRDLTVRDHGARVAIINETLAERYFRGRNPIGERLGRDTADTEIVGVVRDARVNAVREAPVPMVFWPLEAPPGYAGTLLVRTSGDPAAVVMQLRRAVQELEPALPIDRVTTVSGLAAATFRQETLIARLTTVLGVIALLLACLGLYGLMSYAVKQRTGELGIRFALGASRPRVLWMVLRESLVLIVGGLAIGWPAIVAGSRALGTVLYEVEGDDPLIIGGAMAVLLVVGAMSSYLPSWRASRVDPLTALRSE
jgi:predicted permease